MQNADSKIQRRSADHRVSHARRGGETVAEIMKPENDAVSGRQERRRDAGAPSVRVDAGDSPARPFTRAGSPVSTRASVSRRDFCWSAVVLALPWASMRERGVRATAAESKLDLIAIDRARILKAAQQYLKEKPVTITSASSPRSTGGPHDYFSEGDYWWPDPKDPNGPYIERDGISNPDNFNTHRLALIRLSLHVPALVAAWLATRDARYARHAAEHLRAWFVDDATR